MKGNISKKRQRKIEHLRQQYESGTDAKGNKVSRSWLREKAIHHMKMDSEDIQSAFNGGQIY